MRWFGFLLVLPGCGGQITDVDASAEAGVDAGADVVPTKDAAKAPHCDLAASDYDTSCTTASDCTLVFLGNACTSTCACENGAIASSSVGAYQADFEAVSDGGSIVCPCPPPAPPSCCKSSCVVGPCPP
ncbi:MAG TPA: hypothetical protein VH054_11745 [Polyangiaceae bacterium]|jgi:hypothetical protein|nr:hypothetical protein [Polyangiaceae bacterium]